MISKSLITFFFFTITVFANSERALADQASALTGTWRGTMNVTADTCGFGHTPWNFKHKVLASVAVLFLTDEGGIKTWAQVPWLGQNSQGYYFRAVPTREIPFSNKIRMVMAYTYSAVKNRKAKVEFYGGFYNIITGQSCYVVYRGNGTK